MQASARLLSLSAILVLVACGGSNSSAPAASANNVQAPPKAENLSGVWSVEVVVPPGSGGSPGTYQGTWDIADSDGVVSGTAEWPSVGARGRLSGSIHDGKVQLQRVDETGFRGSFEGQLAPDGSMHGSGANDPSSPHGNTATYTWTAHR